MRLIVLVRHGETAANRDRNFGISEDIPLTDTGCAQALDLARVIRSEFRPTRILSSKYHRARQTSEILAAELCLEVDVVHGIHERDFGYLKGMGYEHIPPVAYTDPDWAPEGGESRTALQQRVVSALHDALPSYADEQLLVVCHGAVIQAINAHLLGGWDNALMPGNCGYVAVKFDGGRLLPA